MSQTKKEVKKVNEFKEYLEYVKKNGGNVFAIREYAESGYVYCDDRPDLSFKYKVTVTTADHQINYVMLRNNDLFINAMKDLFSKGCFRFKDMRCKEAVLSALSY